MKPYEEYQTTEYDWLPYAPANWEKRYLFQVNDEQRISNKDVHNQNLLSLSYGNIKRKDINSTKGLLPESFDTYQVVYDGNIILRLTDLQNDHKSLRVGLVTQTGIITSAYNCLKPKNVSSKFIYYLLHSFDLRKVFYGMGGGLRQSMGFKELKYLQLYIPTRPEQDQIVKFLDSKISKINKFIKDKKREIELLKEQIEYLCYFEESDKPVIQSWDSAFNKSWKKIKAKHLFEEINIKNCLEEELLAVTQDRGVVFKKDCAQNYVSPSGSLDGLKLVRKGDFVISLRSFQGGIEYSNYQGIVSPAYNVFRLKPLFTTDKLNTYFRFLFKTRPFIELLKSLGGGIRDGKNISFSDFSQFYMPIPSEEQLSVIIKISDRVDVLQKQYIRMLNVINEYKASLISEVITGKVDVRDVKIDDVFESVTMEETEAETEEVIEE
jgi:type I restriction enzyme S subunit